jgi:hypothetical protein
MNQARENKLGKLYPEFSGLTPGDYCMCAHPRAPLRNPHGIGFPLILAPLLAAGSSVTGLRMALALLAALSAWQLLELMHRLFGSSWHLWVAWAAVAFSAPVVIYATQLYPDLMAAFLIIVSWRLILRSTRLSLIVAAATAALLPWFHLKLVPMTAALLVAAWVRSRTLARDQRRTTVLAVGLVVTVAVILFALTSHALHGSLSPTAAYREFTFRPQGLRDYAMNFYRNVVGGLLSVTYGWIPFAPLHWIGLAGVIPLLRRIPGWTMLAVGAACAYLASLCASESIVHGWAPPGRLLIVLVPFIGIPLCAALRSSRALCLLALPLAVLSGALAVKGAMAFGDLYPSTFEVPGLPLQARLAPAWPLFPDMRSLQSAYAQVPIEVRPGLIQPGDVVPTFRGPIPTGSYEASVEVKGIAGAPASAGPMFALQVIGAQGNVLAERLITAGELSPADFQKFHLRFAVFKGHKAHVNVRYTGTGSALLQSLTLARTTPPPAPFESWPLSVCWILGVIVVGLLVSRPSEHQDVSVVRPAPP